MITHHKIKQMEIGLNKTCKIFRQRNYYGKKLTSTEYHVEWDFRKNKKYKYDRDAHPISFICKYQDTARFLAWTLDNSDIRPA